MANSTPTRTAAMASRHGAAQPLQTAQAAWGSTPVTSQSAHAN
uniref:Uncharacterized protein n=1 Tax=Anguilla anguilla TaxID=7936 RepID=A0A0E9RFI0_ANGAN